MCLSAIACADTRRSVRLPHMALPPNIPGSPSRTEIRAGSDTELRPVTVISAPTGRGMFMARETVTVLMAPLTVVLSDTILVKKAGLSEAVKTSPATSMPAIARPCADGAPAGRGGARTVPVMKTAARACAATGFVIVNSNVTTWSRAITWPAATATTNCPRSWFQLPTKPKTSPSTPATARSSVDWVLAPSRPMTVMVEDSRRSTLTRKETVSWFGTLASCWLSEMEAESKDASGSSFWTRLVVMEKGLNCRPALRALMVGVLGTGTPLARLRTSVPEFPSADDTHSATAEIVTSKRSTSYTKISPKLVEKPLKPEMEICMPGGCGDKRGQFASRTTRKVLTPPSTPSTSVMDPNVNAAPLSLPRTPPSMAKFGTMMSPAMMETVGRLSRFAVIGLDSANPNTRSCPAANLLATDMLRTPFLICGCQEPTMSLPSG
eukprot:616672-Rhodomonas_salina.1